MQCGEPQAPLKELTPGEVAQVWAEAKVIWDGGKEQLYLNDEENRQLIEMQRGYDIDNDLLGELQAFLDTPLPSDWETFQKMERRDYFDAIRAGIPYFRRTEYGGIRTEGVAQRTEISAVEVLNEFFREDNGRANIQTRKANNLMRKLSGWRESRERVSLTGGYGRQIVFRRTQI